MYTYIKKLKRGRYQGYGHGGSIITHQTIFSYRALKAQEKMKSEDIITNCI